MTAVNYKLLNAQRFASVYNWSVHYNNSDTDIFSKKYDYVKIGMLLQRSKQAVIINDDTQYKRVNVKWYGEGVKVRDCVFGKEIKTKRQFLLKNGQFLYSRIDARHGAFGLANDEVNNGIVTNDFPIFDINSNQIVPEFLSLITGSKPFFDFCQSISSGTTDRQRMNETNFLDFEIPLPDLTTQNQLVNQYNQKLTQAQEAEDQADELEKGIESFLLQELGIEKPKSVEKKQGLELVSFKELSRWDYGYATGEEQDIFTVLEKSSYPTVKLGEAYNFINRPWSSKKYPNSTFRYVEIGSVDSFLGITNYTEIETKKAPSRATQIIKENDLIVGLTRPNLKKFTLVNKEYDGYICSSAFQIISPSVNYSLEFLLEFLKSDAGVKQISFFMAGALYPAITSTQLKNLYIPLPPKDIQTQIVNHITSQREQIKALRTQAEALRKQAKANFEKEIFN